MIVGIGAAASLLDAALSPLVQPSTAKLSATSQSGSSAASAASIFSVDNQSSTTISSSDAISNSSSGNISPPTMSALIAAQCDASATAPTATPASTMTAAAAPKDPLADLFSLLDGDGDGKISKSEFESALGAGGTNLQNADSVFAKLDKDGDGSVSQSELGSALKGKGHHHTAGANGSTGGAGALAQALQDAASSEQTNADGSVTTTMTYADGSTVTMSTAAGNTTPSSSNLLEQMIKRQSEMLAASAASSVAIGSSLAVTI